MGNVYFNGSPLTTIGVFTAGALIGIAFDFANGHIWFTLDGATWNNAIIALQNPVGNVGGISVPSGTLMPAYDVLSNDRVAQNTVNFWRDNIYGYSTLYAALQAAGYTTFDGSGDILMSQAVM